LPYAIICVLSTSFAVGCRGLELGVVVSQDGVGGARAWSRRLVDDLLADGRMLLANLLQHCSELVVVECFEETRQVQRSSADIAGADTLAGPDKLTRGWRGRGRWRLVHLVAAVIVGLSFPSGHRGEGVCGN